MPRGISRHPRAACSQPAQRAEEEGGGYGVGRGGKKLFDVLIGEVVCRACALSVVWDGEAK
eukprot:scaffold297097_cov22-Tisochrysis_lutea.AAC.1